MEKAFIKAALILCCHCLAVGNTGAASWAPSYLSPAFSAISASLPKSKSRNYHAGARTKTIAAAIMQEDSGMSANVISEKRAPSSLPNWRVIDVHNDNGEEGVISSPFCHPLTDESLAATATAAPWSKSAYQSALDLYERMQTCTDPYIAPMIKSALHDMEMAYRLYGPFCMVGSYNGGKDAVVIFHLMRAVHAHYCSEMQKGDDNLTITRPRVIYFQHQDEFPEVLSLLDDTVERFDVDMLAFKEGVSFGEGLKYLVDRNIAPGKDGLSFHDSTARLPPPHPLAFVLGTRKDDPNAGSQGIYSPSSHYMPPFLRVNPILNWTYGHVWHFLRLFELPYCSLYDDGFTSLGTVKNTLPCPALKKSGEDEEYWPAYMLREWDMERAGRIDKKKAKEKSAEDGKVTISQTSSTISLPTAENETPKLTKSISAILNIDDAVTASNNRANATASTQFLSLGQPTVGLIVIGDELLKGMTPDSNIIAAAKALRSNNISLSRVSIISDDGQDIVDEIRRFTKEVDVIITSGGVGPTHDDVTIKSIAEALGLDMEMHDEMAELLLKKMGAKDTGEEKTGGDNSKEDRKKTLNRQMSEGQIKMSTLPTSSVLQYLSDTAEEWPVLQCQNIFILPGVPSYFEKKINDLAAYLPTASSKLAQAAAIGETNDEDIGLSVDTSAQTERQQPTRSPRSDTYRIVLSLEEESIVSALNVSVAAHPHVIFGSYPIVDDPEYKTIITLEGRFYTGGYTKGSQRLLEKSVLDTRDSESLDKDNKRIQSLFFSKEEMDRNVESALKDLTSRLPEEGILCIDSCDDLRVK
mmetsp:Transcript_7815/g.17639  ORF Transcript_7815/g.17639 Transcript_7815/m.17639 type:complete len:810 (-) Transcript_7815:1298-3727(-)